MELHLFHIEYKGTTNAELVEFLRSRPAQDLGDMGVMLEFKPVIDGVFLKEYPYILYKRAEFQKKELMAGCNSHEGYIMVKLMLNDPNMSTAKENLKKQLKTCMNSVFMENSEELSEAAFKCYIGDEAVGNLEVFKQQYAKCYGDLVFNGPNHDLALKHSGKLVKMVIALCFITFN